jgi:formylglycine-generating enzyme required for sulfatase activity
MLAQDVHLWRGSPPEAEALIPAERLARIEPFAAALALGDDERELLRRSRARVEEAEAREMARLEREVATLRQRNRLQRTLFAVFAGATLGIMGLIIVLAWPSVLRDRTANAVALVPVQGIGVAFETYEVTNERYGWCIAAGACDTPEGFRQIKADADWEVKSQLPVVGVDAAAAMAFCKWIGRRLPTAEEWAAVAPPFERWKEMGPEEALLCHLPGEACYHPNAPVELTPVGAGRSSQYGASDDPAGGIYDLVGSVNEWTRTQRIDDSESVTLTDLPFIPTESVVTIIILGDNYRVPVAAAGAFNLLESYSTSDAKSEAIGIRCVQ